MRQYHPNSKILTQDVRGVKKLSLISIQKYNDVWKYEPELNNFIYTLQKKLSNNIHYQVLIFC